MHLTIQKLKSILQDTGLVDEATFNAALQEGTHNTRDLIDAIVNRGTIPDYYITELLSKNLNIPIANLAGIQIPPEVLALVPENYAQAKHLVVFEYKPGELVKVAMLDPLDYDAIEYLRAKLGVWVEAYIVSKPVLDSALRAYKGNLGSDFSRAITENTQKSLSVTGDGNLSKVAEAVPIIALLKNIVDYAVSLGASDIHFEPFFKSMVVRYRIDGVLREVFDLPKQVAPSVVARVKILGNLQIDEHRLPQDGRFKFEIAESADSLDIRVNITPVLYGEKVEMRLLKSTARLVTFEDIGVSKYIMPFITEEIKKPHGMILVTGPTGSGKTTTLYTILHLLNKPGVNITTIEDPIEYEVDGVNQVQVNIKAGVTFVTGLRSILRQDPNIIMVGEIRDAETVDIGVQAALTGHLVLSSLHTNDAPSALPRLLDMGAPAFLLASTVNLVIAQRLVRRICTSCIETYEVLPEIIRLIEAQVELLGHKDILAEEMPKIFYRGKGCNVCSNSGYRGQVAIFEILPVSDAIKALVLRSAPSGEIKAVAIKEGMRTLFEDGLDKVKNGVTTVEEILRVIQE